ncbi:ABC transporter ATP-binding protein [Clostridium oryzae]|uniref:Bacitracin export ATP-binding protein BceA n=1 Tax=Clostridium oryzae TaxID=1450648 RepID=A0A1V4IVY5_9CLOT|nr:ABC transporter ATP-binding protein [Clostridium oryzae]OPJ63955.1 bacitracin export ATP-binding protein BceA [Clostridium oryzae]
MEILKGINIVKTYNNEINDSSQNIINGLDITIHEGEFTAIMGPSGSGKTTLLNILSGIDKPTIGEVNIMGMDMVALNDSERAIFRRKNLGLIFQNFNLLEDLTLKENAALPLLMQGEKQAKIEQAVNELFKLMNIYEIKDKYPNMVSQGQRQRAASCRALATNPRIIFADEPTGNLDSKAAKKFMNYMRIINSEKKVTLLLATHDSMAASYCSRVIFIKDGNIFADIYKKEEDKKFLNKILDCLVIMGGDD